jgi:hypothetical protein
VRRLEGKILETLATHAKKLKECTGKRKKTKRGNEKTSKSLLLTASKTLYEALFIPENPRSGLLEGEQAIHVPMSRDWLLGLIYLDN